MPQISVYQNLWLALVSLEPCHKPSILHLRLGIEDWKSSQNQMPSFMFDYDSSMWLEIRRKSAQHKIQILIKGFKCPPWSLMSAMFMALERERGKHLTLKIYKTASP